MRRYIDYTLLPAHIRGGMKRYIEGRTPPGGFLTAVLNNNLMEAMGRADRINRERLFDICNFLYNEAPAVCWGSPERVKRWLEGRKSEVLPD